MNMEDIAIVKIAITLWTSSYETIELLNSYRNTDEWFRATNLLCGHSTKLPLPEVLKAKINNALPFIGFELFKFTNFLYLKIFHDYRLLEYALVKLCWKMQGVIDRKKTVKNLINDPTLILSTRYELACLFCFEEDILKLWSKLNVYEKSNFLSISNQPDYVPNNVNIWSLYNGKMEIILSKISIEQGCESVSELNFLCSIYECVPEAVEFYFKKIPPGERISAIQKAMHMLEEIYPDTRDKCASSHQSSIFYNGLFEEMVVFLFTETDKESVAFFADELEYYNLRVLECFLKWPFWENFLCIFEKLQPHFKGNDFSCIVARLEENIFHYCAMGDNSYMLILKDVWKVSSNINKGSVYFFLPKLLSTILQLGEESLVSIILNDFQPAVKASLLCTDEGMVACICLANDKKWNILEKLIKRCTRAEKLKDLQSLFDNRNKVEGLFDSNISLEKIDYGTVSHIYNFIEDIIKKRGINDIECLASEIECPSSEIACNVNK